VKRGSRSSIRRQLTLLGVVAALAIWLGAGLQYVELRAEQREVATMRADVDLAAIYAEAARSAAHERGLSDGWLALDAPGQTAGLELAEARAALDRAVALLGDPGGAAPQSERRVSTGVSVRIEALTRVRGQIDRREIPSLEAFEFYSSLVESLQSALARRLGSAMIAVGVPYEHLNHLENEREQLAQIRGLTHEALKAGTLLPETALALVQRIALYDRAEEEFERSAPAPARAEVAAMVDASAVRRAVELSRQLARTRRIDVIGLDATAWWSLSSQGVDGLERATQSASTALLQKADLRIATIGTRLEFTVAGLVALGMIILLMALSMASRIVRGINRLMTGLESIGDRRDFTVRIAEDGADEFAFMSKGINSLIAIANDTLQEKEALSLIDVLTGTMNRRGFERQLAARTTPTRSHTIPLSVVMLDLDHFKSVNDSLGHASGDLVLRRLGRLLLSHVRPDDLVARIGGEEFVVLLNGCPLWQASRVAETLRAAIAGHDFGVGRQVTASLGVAEWKPTQAPETLLIVADTELYLSKTRGRNRVSPAIATSMAPSAAQSGCPRAHVVAQGH
jgi:diguanylate cyclase (GGDEF)-like protein